ncbi:putative HTH-type transcriptional regulator YusO [Anoxybacillus sp. P3H1B]|jgi:MarR family transcriptional regulator, organic hydroperoxide resistance regulator|uniref:MarR family winged helix-turn-helix transcriptional regulator n=1 Tax=Anoxybacillaceae TaxID=3120669 RepID=UPI00079754E4|nr:MULTISPECIES: MarR family transcriptional regulator [Anoxybacillus]KXG09369.1 putative HTH-type transcriptional regulator YusO [Anoxybacillus sp. P3H1B]MBB3908032.1 DNA-binding MarR family transcriptional regulator [Anoxybacillus rupiensis]MBS2771834.1 MarR family transcriptional regulator [Anoxybacillus rupiensis]
MNPLGRDLMYSVFRIQKALYRLVREDATRVGITELQLIILYTLFKQENVRLNDLAEKLNMSNSTVSGTVDRLVSADLVMRETSKEDRRAVTLYLTDKGRKKLKEAFNDEDSALFRQLKRLTDVISKEELEHLISLHGTIRDILLGEE